MDQNFMNGFPGSNQQGDNTIPASPQSQDQIGIRTMQSDMESIQQTGGGAPEARIMSASEIYAPQQQPAQPQAPQTPPQPTYPPMGGYAPMNNEQSPFGQIPAQQPDMNTGITPEPSKSSMKTILMIVGIIIVAIGVGFGVYFLVSSLNAAPETPPVAVESPVLPSGAPIQTPMMPVESATPVPTPVTHQSMMVNATKSEQLLLSTFTIDAFVAAVKTAAQEKILAGNVKDISFVDSANAFVTSEAVVQAYFPSIASSLLPLIEKDYTMWIYGDKTGGNKLGIALPLKSVVNPQDVASIMTLAETAPKDFENLFVSPVTAPAKIEFKEGYIDKVLVRYLAFNQKNQMIFEYAPMTINGKNYLVLGTSYNQMADLVKRVKAAPMTAAQPQAPQTPQAPATTTPQAPTPPPVVPPTTTTP